jgi:hypothetical protein
MAMNIFLLLSGLGVVFLLYVLAGFWKEGHRSANNARKYAAEFGESNWYEVAVVTHPISHNAQGGQSVIPFQARDRNVGGKSEDGQAGHEAVEIPLRKISTR